MSKLSDICSDSIVLVRWRDIVHLEEGYHPEDGGTMDTISPILEFVGRLIKVKRGIAAFQMEWDVFRHTGYDMEGAAGHETQLIPVGCIESLHELTVGKCLFSRSKGGTKKNARPSSKPDSEPKSMGTDGAGAS